jgi:hypothetical protein
MAKKTFFQFLLVLDCWLISLSSTQAQYTIHDSQIKATKDWILGAIAKFLLLGVGIPLFISILTYWLLQAYYSYHTAKATLGLWLSWLIWFTGYALAFFNGDTSLEVMCLLVFLACGASAVGYFTSRKLRPE